MSDLISRKALLERLEKIYGTDSIVDKIMLRFLKKLIWKQPTVDAVEVRHGKWIPEDSESDVIFLCSECETKISTSWDYDEPEMWGYCPNCGAKMDGGD